MNIDPDEADRMGCLFGYFVARRTLQVLGVDPEREPAFAGIIIKATREMYVALAQSENPLEAMGEVLDLEGAMAR